MLAVSRRSDAAAQALALAAPRRRAHSAAKSSASGLSASISSKATRAACSMWRAAPVTSPGCRSCGRPRPESRDARASRGSGAGSRCAAAPRAASSSAKTSSGRYESRPMRAPRASSPAAATRTRAGRWRAVTSGSSTLLGVQDAPEHERAVDLLDAVLGERARAAAPSSPAASRPATLPEVSTSSRCTTPLRSPPSPTPCTSGCRAITRVQQRPRLVLAQRMHRHAGGLVDGEPAGPLRAHHEPAPGIGERALLVAARERRDRQLAAAREARALLAFAERAPVQAHGAAREQPAHLGARELELLGQEQVETPSRVLRRNDERARRRRSRRQGSRTLTAFRSTPQSGIPRSQLPRCRWRAPSPHMSR